MSEWCGGCELLQGLQEINRSACLCRVTQCALTGYEEQFLDILLCALREHLPADGLAKIVFNCAVGSHATALVQNTGFEWRRDLLALLMARAPELLPALCDNIAMPRYFNFDMDVTVLATTIACMHDDNAFAVSVMKNVLPFVPSSLRVWSSIHTVEQRWWCHAERLSRVLFALLRRSSEACDLFFSDAEVVAWIHAAVETCATTTSPFMWELVLGIAENVVQWSDRQPFVSEQYVLDVTRRAVASYASPDVSIRVLERVLSGLHVLLRRSSPAVIQKVLELGIMKLFTRLYEEDVMDAAELGVHCFYDDDVDDIVLCRRSLRSAALLVLSSLVPPPCAVTVTEVEMAMLTRFLRQPGFYDVHKMLVNIREEDHESSLALEEKAEVLLRHIQAGAFNIERPRSGVVRAIKAVRPECSDLVDNATCPVCLNTMTVEATTKLPCSHLVHTLCFAAWADDYARNTCPVCNQDVVAIAIARSTGDDDDDVQPKPTKMARV